MYSTLKSKTIIDNAFNESENLNNNFYIHWLVMG